MEHLLIIKKIMKYLFNNIDNLSPDPSLFRCFYGFYKIRKSTTDYIAPKLIFYNLLNSSILFDNLSIILKNKQ